MESLQSITSSGGRSNAGASGPGGAGQAAKGVFFKSLFSSVFGAKPAYVPNQMHFVWLGGRLPDGRQVNIIRWAKAVPGAKVNLWLDEYALEALGYEVSFLERNGVTIRRVSELFQASTELREATHLLRTRDRLGVNVGAAGALSDIVRLEILKQEGGHYMDSDNQPGENAGQYVDMVASNQSLLGWSDVGEGFSNDAMSARPGSQFINNYLKAVYDNLKPEAISAITSRDPKQVKDWVMNTTGPDAMKYIDLRVDNEKLNQLRTVLSKDGSLECLDEHEAKLEQINLRILKQLKEITKEKNVPELDDLIRSLGYGSGLFIRECGNAWVPK